MVRPVLQTEYVYLEPACLRYYCLKCSTKIRICIDKFLKTFYLGGQLRCVINPMFKTIMYYVFDAIYPHTAL